MKKTNYIYAALLIIIVILVVALSHKGTGGQTASISSTVTATTLPTGGTDAAKSDVYPIHVRKGGPSIYYFPTTTISSQVRVDSPPTNTTVTSPITVSGIANGSWFFEGSARALLTDSKGKIIVGGSVKAQSDWTANDPVPFLGKLVYPRQPTGSAGVLIFHNDNPSGLAANDKWVEILVTFK